jgi:hypothetical protein
MEVVITIYQQIIIRGSVGVNTSDEGISQEVGDAFLYNFFYFIFLTIINYL